MIDTTQSHDDNYQITLHVMVVDRKICRGLLTSIPSSSKSVSKAVRYESKLVCWIVAVTFALLVSRADAFQATTIIPPDARQYRTPTRSIVGRHQMLKTSANFECLTIPELKDILRERGAKVSGNKQELIERLSLLHADIDGEVESDNVEEDNSSQALWNTWAK